MASYDQYDDAALEKMLAEAVEYDQRSAIRQEIRKRKKERGQQVGRPKKGATGYNRFAGSTAPVNRPSPKNYVFQEDSSESKPAPSKKSESAASPQAQSPVTRPRSPTPPPTPEQSKPSGVDEPDIPPEEQEEAPVSPPPSPEPPSGPPEEEEETTDGVPDVGLGEEGTDPSPPPPPAEEEHTEEGSGVEVDQPSSPKEDTDYSKSSRDSAHSSTQPRTLADYQKLTARSKVKAEDTSEDSTPLSNEELQKYLVAYVNQELGVEPPMPVRGKALYDTCSDPTNLCKLINKSVRNTVDLRALTKVSASMSTDQRDEALQENMTLVIESARAIGCRVEEDSIDNILAKSPHTIRDFLVDLIRARVVHLPGMEDEPSSTFTNMALLFSKLGISVDESDGGSWREPSPAAKSTPSPTGELTYEERAARRKAEREKRQQEIDSGESGQLTYEERAAQRKAERERRRKEREALAQ